MLTQRRQFCRIVSRETPPPHAAVEPAGNQQPAARAEPRRADLRLDGDRLHVLLGLVFLEQLFGVHVGEAGFQPAIGPCKAGYRPAPFFQASSSLIACIPSWASGSGWPPLSYCVLEVSIPRQRNHVWKRAPMSYSFVLT